MNNADTKKYVEVNQEKLREIVGTRNELILAHVEDETDEWESFFVCKCDNRHFVTFRIDQNNKCEMVAYHLNGARVHGCISFKGQK